MSTKMMHYSTWSRQVLLVILMLACILFPFVHMGCDPSILLNVENQSDSNITIFINQRKLGNIQANEQEAFNTALIPYHPDAYWAPEDYLIEAKTIKDEVLYSERFTWQELDDMDWTIVIPPSED